MYVFSSQKNLVCHFLRTKTSILGQKKINVVYVLFWQECKVWWSSGRPMIAMFCISLYFVFTSSFLRATWTLVTAVYIRSPTWIFLRFCSYLSTTCIFAITDLQKQYFRGFSLLYFAVKTVKTIKGSIICFGYTHYFIGNDRFFSGRVWQ
jgi:hypothetical protein